MGTELLNYCCKKVKKEWKTAFYATIILGFMVHSFNFTNNMLNHDGLYNYYASQNMVSSGRWFLSIVCGISSFFNLSWINGVLSILYIALVAVIIVDIFEMKNPVLIVISCGLLVTFPAVTETFSFGFTADGYMFAMLLAVLSVRLSCMGETRLMHYILSAILLCLTCGIYQAYVSFALVLSIAYFMTVLLENKYSKKEYLMWVFKQMAIYGVGMIAYVIVWKTCMMVQGFEATTYLGMDSIGKIKMDDFTDALGRTIKSFILFFVEGNIFKHGITLWSGLNILFLLAAATVILLAVIKSGICKRGILAGLFFLAGAVVPIVIYIWYFVTPAAYSYGVRMEQSICVLYILAAVLFERWASVRWSTFAGMLLAVIIFNNSITANVYYYYMDRSNRQSYAAAVEISAKIHELDDGTVKKVAIGGALPVWTEQDYTDPKQLATLGVLKNVDKNVLRNQTCTALFLANEVGFTLSYYQNREDEMPRIEKNPYEPVPDNWEFKFPMVSAEELKEICLSEQYQAMPCWPAKDSVQVFRDIIIVKLSMY